MRVRVRGLQHSLRRTGRETSCGMKRFNPFDDLPLNCGLCMSYDGTSGGRCRLLHVDIETRHCRAMGLRARGVGRSARGGGGGLRTTPQQWGRGEGADGGGVGAGNPLLPHGYKCWVCE